MTRSSNLSLVVGATIGAVCLAAGFVLGSTSTAPLPASDSTFDDVALRAQLDELRRAVQALARARSEPLKAVGTSVPTKIPVESTPAPPGDENIADSFDDVAAALAALTARIDALDVALPKPLRPTDEHGVPSARKPMDVNRIGALLTGDRGDASRLLSFNTYAQVYDQLGSPSAVYKPESRPLQWIYKPGGAWGNKQIFLEFHDGLVVNAIAIN